MAIKTYNGLPLLEATIGASHTGINKISLVDLPAVESDFLSFNKDRRMTYAVQNEEKRIVRGVIMRADFPIYRNDQNGEYYVIYRAETVRQMAEKYLFDGKQNNVNLMHEDGSDVEGVNMVQFFIKDVSNGVNPEGFDEIEDGSLFAEFHVCNDQIWEQIKSGTYKGFSLEGRFHIEQETNEEMSLIERAFTKLYKTEGMSKLAKFKSVIAELLADDAEVKMGSMTTDKGVLSWEGEEDLKQGDEVFVLDEAGERSTPEDGEYATDEVIVVVEGGKVTEVRERPVETDEAAEEAAEEAEVEAAEETPEENPESETGSLEERVAQIESILKQVTELLGINNATMSELRSEIEDLKKKPAADPAHKAFQKVATTEATGNNKLDNLRKLMES